MKNTNMLNRIAALEKHVGADAVATLHLEGGVVHTISAAPKHLFALFDAATAQEKAKLAGEAVPDSDLSRELDWIRRAERIDENAHLIELLAALLAGPVSGEINPD
jgi:hypothetical protein